MIRLFVGNLPYEATETELHDWFNEVGVETVSVSLQMDRFNGKPRGFAYVEVSDEESSVAVQRCNGRAFLGRTLVIDAQYKPSEACPDFTAASLQLR